MLFIPCPFKYFTHLDCPGCGFQRALLALFQGNFLKSFKQYPPTIFFLISFLLVTLTYLFKWNKNSKTLTTFLMITGFIVLINYIYKIINHQLY